MMKPASHAALSNDQMPTGRIDPTKARTSIRLRQARAPDLQNVNNLIAAAIDTWSLADRVKRISLPLYRYHEDDLRDMQLVVAHSSDDEIFGVAALDHAYATDLFDGLQTSVLHGLYVAPNLHRNGVGSVLLEQIEDMTRSNDTEVLLVKARPEAISFFSSHGFESLPARDHRRDYPYQLYKRLPDFGPDRF